MNKFAIIEFSELNTVLVQRDNFQDQFTIGDLDGSILCQDLTSQHDNSMPLRLDALVMVLVLEGSATLNIDYVSYPIEKNTFITIMPTHTSQIVKLSNDFKGKMIVVNKSFIEKINPVNNHAHSVSNYMEVRKNPCNKLEPEEINKLDSYVEFMRSKVKDRTHFYQKEALQNSFVGFLLEMGNILMSKKDHMVKPTLSRKEELFEQFLQLLFNHCKEQHVVTFYAEKLCITPQYLSLILKELTGKSANKWIDDALIVEAKILLKAPQATVQQVADMLHFSDQSTFGKFFKKHVGASPMEYRKS